MAIIRAAVGENLKEFDDASSLDDVWAFINSQMATSNTERAVVLMDDGGDTMGQIWDSSLYYAHWETPVKMRAYFNLIGFDQSN